MLWNDIEWPDFGKHSGPLVHGSRPLDRVVADPADTPWVRWTRTGTGIWAVVDAPGDGAVTLPGRADHLDLASAALADGTPVPASADGGGVTVELPVRAAEMPTAVGCAAP
ncbi:hypothetical protein [Pseudonocardia xinjiangensis]|uniref:Uncharacterized protein n=1 Tax=Pseudonocardia xinjiangensis TaxID=75289 RepID=A0ABX1RCE5_9PSEU|nr:hypothetical protein [Pseudonocardia xinjiangensis]NMH76790.1 hypothetical protein [Pseudonocardia xinjiangensis]